MNATDYLIVGSSHAALEAISAIRLQDPDSSLTVLTAERHLPYSPTLLPYVVSGRSAAGKVTLRNEAFFAEQRVRLQREATVASVQPEAKTVALDDGTRWQYGKLLLATGASPSVPPIAGLDTVRSYRLRSLDDSLALRDAIGTARRAVVLGAGLIGMHAAENLAAAGVAVTVIEPCHQVLPSYFDPEAAGHIERSFMAHGVAFRCGRTAVSVTPDGAGCGLTLDDGAELDADLLLVATGVRAAFGYLAGSGIATGRGILVDATMRTSADSVWAAGDVAEAPCFPGPGTAVAGILPEAVAQGRTAGMAMAGDAALTPYRGSVPRNTYCFFGQSAISVGSGVAGESPEAAEVVTRRDPAAGSYCRIALKDGRLLGLAAVNLTVDAGILCELIVRQVDLGAVKQRFVEQPCETARMLMSRLWR
nr:FAD-dependent oxidoreductase [uncultured Rhodopila sp.]